MLGKLFNKLMYIFSYITDVELSLSGVSDSSHS